MNNPIHIGKIIRNEVEYLRLTHKEFAALIYKNHKTIPDIYLRSSLSTDLLISICGALKKDLLKTYYEQEPMLSLRNDEINYLKSELANNQKQIENMNRELQLNIALCDARTEALQFAKDMNSIYKNR